VAKAQQQNSGRLTVQVGKGESDAEALARTVLRPAVNAAVTVRSFNSLVAGMDLDMNALVAELAAQCEAASDGNLQRPEAMLMAQAHTLDAIFNSLAMRSYRNIGEYTEAADRYMRLALKAQGQCRATLETLAAIKNPPMVIARQANVTSGPQQVNNSLTVGSRAGESESTPTELSGGNRELRQDARAPAAAFGNDSTLAAVGEVHRAEDVRRQGEIVAEPLARRAS